MIKKISFFVYIFLGLSMLFSQVLITNGNNHTINKSAILEMRSTNKGVLLPRNTIEDYRDFSNFSVPIQNGLFFFDKKTGRLVMKGVGGGKQRWFGSSLSTDQKRGLSSKLNILTSKSVNTIVVSGFPDVNNDYGYIYPRVGSSTVGWTDLGIFNTISVENEQLELFVHANGVAGINTKSGSHSGFGFAVGIFVDGKLARISKFYKNDNFKNCNSMGYSISAKLSLYGKGKHDIRLYVRNLKKQGDEYNEIFYGNGCLRDDGISNNTYMYSEIFSRKNYALPIFDYNPKEWMKDLDNVTLLKNVTICGSHDSGTYTFSSLTGFGFAKTQDGSIKEQLNKGVRYLDIRLYYDKSREKLYIYHGGFSTGLRFKEDVLSVLFEFLSKHPSETIFVVIKNENNSNMQFWYSAVNKILENYKDKFYRDFNVNKTTIDDVRGKIVLISRESRVSPYLFVNDNSSSLVYYSGTEDVFFQDIYKVGFNYSTKLNEVKSCIRKAQNIADKNILFINNFNATYGGTPGRIARYINSNISEYLKTKIVSPENYLNPPYRFLSRRLGFFVMDFVTSSEAAPILDYSIRQSILSNNIYYQDIYNLDVNYVK